MTDTTTVDPTPEPKTPKKTPAQKKKKIIGINDLTEKYGISGVTARYRLRVRGIHKPYHWVESSEELKEVVEILKAPLRPVATKRK